MNIQSQTDCDKTPRSFRCHCVESHHRQTTEWDHPEETRHRSVREDGENDPRNDCQLKNRRHHSEGVVVRAGWIVYIIDIFQ